MIILWSTSKRRREIVFVLGLLATIGISPVRADDFRDEFPPIYTETPAGVNLQTGRFRFQLVSLTIGPFIVRRGPGQSGFDFPGRLYWHTQITAGGGQMTLVTIPVGDVMFDFASASGNIVPWSASARGWKLDRSSSTYYFTNKLGDIYTYVDHPGLQSSGYPENNKIPASVVYADGHRLDFNYDSQARTRTVTSNRGYALVYDYDANGNLITICGYNTSINYVDINTTCSAAALKVSFQYTLNGSGAYQLTRVTDVLGAVTTISYHSNGRTNCITLPGLPTCEIRNELYGVQPGEATSSYKADQVRRQSTASGAVWTYTYTNPPAAGTDDPPRMPGEIRLTYGAAQGPDGAFASAEFANGFIQTLSTNLGSTTYEFNGVDPKKVTMGEGNSMEFFRDNNGNVLSRTVRPKPGSGLNPQIVTQAFPYAYPYSQPAICDAVSPKLCTKPFYRVDERGNRTDFTYDAAHGGVLTETGPAINGIRPQIRYNYAQRYAWVKNSTGGYVQAVAPIWLLVRKSFCKAGAASGAGCAIAGDEVITTYDYGPNVGPNNLLLRGVVEDASGLALRTCYSYDWQGNRISETRPRAGLGGCP